jgi:hypothetical protein
MNLLTTYRHDSELQAITAPPLNSTIHKSPQHPLRFFPACCVFASRSLTTASNSGESSASHSQVLSSQTPVQNPLGCPSCIPYNSSARPSQTTAFILVCVSVASGTCLPSRSIVAAICSCLLRICCLAMHFVPFSVSRPLRRSECCFRVVRHQRLFLWPHSSCSEQIYHTCNVFFLDCLQRM